MNKQYVVSGAVKVFGRGTNDLKEHHLDYDIQTRCD